MSDVSQFLASSAPDTSLFSARGLLYHNPGALLQPGRYTLAPPSGGQNSFEVTLPPATGSKNSFVFYAAPGVGPTNSVTLRASGNDTLNTTANGSYLVDSPGQTVHVSDVDAGRYDLQVQNVSAVASAQRVVTASKNRVTAVGGSTTLLYAGTPVADQIVLVSCSFTEQGVQRCVTLNFLSQLGCTVDLDLGRELVPEGCSIEELGGQLVDITEDVTLPSPRVTQLSARQINVHRTDSIAGVVSVRVHVRTQTKPALGQTLLAAHTMQPPLLSYAALEFAEVPANPGTRAWTLTDAAPGNSITVEGGSVLTGFVPGETYLISFTAAEVEGVLPVVFEDVQTGDVVSGSSVVRVVSAPENESTLGNALALYTPAHGDGVRLVVLNSADAPVASGVAFVQQLPRAWSVSGEVYGWPGQGVLNAAWPDAYLPEGVYTVNSALGPFDIRLPEATGSQKVFVFVADQVSTHPCDVRVPTGNSINGLQDDVYVLARDHQGVVFVDAGSQHYVTLGHTFVPTDTSGAVDGDWAQYDRQAQVFRPATVSHKTIFWEETQYSPSNFALSSTPSVLGTFGNGLAVQSGDVFELEGQVTVDAATNSGIQVRYRKSSGAESQPVLGNFTSSGSNRYTLPVVHDVDSLPIEVIATATGTCSVVSAHTVFTLIGWRNFLGS